MDALSDIIQQDRAERQESQSSQSESIRPIDMFGSNIEFVQKKNLHPAIFLSIILTTMICCYANIYYIFQPLSQTENKGILAGVLTGVIIVVGALTFSQLVTFKEFLRLAFMVDNILLVTVAVSLAFTSLIMIFDVSNQWQYKVLEVGLPTLIVIYATLTRIFLVHLKWSKWRLIVFKLSIMLNNLMFLSMVLHFIYIDFSYTQHYLPTFDSKVKDFMLLYIFAMFSYTYELYSKVTDLDHTCNFRYCYTVMNMDKSHHKRKQSIIQNRRESRKSIALLEQFQRENSHQINPSDFKVKNQKKSKFSDVLNVQYRQ